MATIRSLGPACVSAVIAAGMLAACRPNIVSPPNPAPATLDVSVTVTDLAAPGTPDDDGRVMAIVQFFQGGSPVRFASGETVACNGTALDFNELLGYTARVPRVAPGGVFNCTYTRSGGVATIPLTVPPRPQITSPAAGTTVTRSVNTTVTYVPGGGTGVDAGGGDPSMGFSHNQPKPDNGTWPGFDTTRFAAGPGTISLTRILETNTPVAGFSSTRTKYSISNSIAITWN